MGRTAQFSTGFMLAVVASVSVSFALIRFAFLLQDPEPSSYTEAVLQIILMLSGSHLFVITLGVSMGKFFAGRRGAVVGGIAAVSGLWILILLFFPTIH